MVNIEPRHKAADPRPERIAGVVLGGCEFVVGWGGEPGETDTYCDGHISVRGNAPMAWVECVKIDGKWWDARDMFSSEFCDKLDAALLALEDFSACAP